MDFFMHTITKRWGWNNLIATGNCDHDFCTYRSFLIDFTTPGVWFRAQTSRYS